MNRVLLKPFVVMSRSPGMVCTKVPLDSPESYFETMLTPDEAIQYATDLLNDAQRAKWHAELIAREKR